MQEAWARDCWDVGFNKAFFTKFTGNSSEYIIDVEENLKKEDGDTLHISLAMPLINTGIVGDNRLRGNEEKMRLRSFDVQINLLRNGVILKGKMEEKKTSLDLRAKAKILLSNWLSNRNDLRLLTKIRLRTSTGSGGIKVGHALFLGAQAAVFAVGGNPEWNKQVSVSGGFSE